MGILVKSLNLNLALLLQIFLELPVIEVVLLNAPMHHVHVSLARLNLNLLNCRQLCGKEIPHLVIFFDCWQHVVKSILTRCCNKTGMPYPATQTLLYVF